MPAADTKSLYRHTGLALMRAAVAPLTDAPDRWPDLDDLDGCRVWLDTVWSRADLDIAVRQASPALGEAVDAIRSGRSTGDKQVRSATLSTVRYLLRSIGRPTPFGLFAGVVPVDLAATSGVRWGHDHRVRARAGAEWLADIVTRAEQLPDLLERLDVVTCDLAVRRGGRLEIPKGPNRVTILHTAAVSAVRDLATTPIRFAVLVDAVANQFSADREIVRTALTELVRHGFLVTNLRAPFTVTDPFTHIVDALHAAGADALPEAMDLLRELDSLQDELRRHNDPETQLPEQNRVRTAIIDRMRAVSSAGRTPLAVDLLLDTEIRLPQQVASEMERAASALLRLTRRPTGEPAWRDYHAAFVDKYGTGTLVALTDVLDADAGLGYPAGYRGSVLPAPRPDILNRDERLLTMAWQALSTGAREIVLTDEMISELTGDGFDPRFIPPHVELSARIHATSTDALDRGDFMLTVAPARSAGTLTSRFTPIATGSGLEQVYRTLPAATDSALRVQMSFGPLYPHAENVCRVPAYLEHLLPLGEHRDCTDNPSVITIDDLAITATRRRLHLVSRSRNQVIEPQVFHALALDKQPPLVARFLAHLPRAFSAAWYQFDWGPHRGLPFLPQVRYRRTILSPAQWRLTTADLPATPEQWPHILDQWRGRWGCPHLVELRDANRTLRLTLDESAHVVLLRNHVTKHGQAILYQATPATDYGWIDGHAHEIAFPLATARPAAPSPLRGHEPLVTNTHGQLPNADDAQWISAKLFTHPERMTEIVTDHLPTLLKRLTGTECWWLRYRSTHETDHLRLRILASPDDRTTMRTIGQWAQQMRQDGLTGQLVFDTYVPEIGRYGDGVALSAAENVFIADSATAAAQLRHQCGTEFTAQVVANMVGIVVGFLGDPAEAMAWLANQPALTAPAVDRAVTAQAIHLATDPSALPRWNAEVATTWHARADALAAYRKALPTHIDLAVVLESLLHMHHNRMVGIAPDGERTCRRLARQTAVSWQARAAGGTS